MAVLLCLWEGLVAVTLTIQFVRQKKPLGEGQMWHRIIHQGAAGRLVLPLMEYSESLTT